MKPWLLLVTALLTLVSQSTLGAQVGAEAGTIISGGDLPHAVRLAPADDDALRRRINTPPRLDNRPERAAGPSYTLTSDYWSSILQRPGRPTVEPDAAYFPEGGIVRASQGGQSLWLALDVRQQAILDRYIRLTRAGLLGERPSLVSVLLATARDEDLTIEAGGAALTTDQVGALWSALGSLDAPQLLEPPRPPKVTARGVWLVVGLEESRSLQLLYQPGSPGTLTDALGRERYSVPPALASLLDGLKPASLAINDEKGPGSYFWWAVMLGAGLLSLGAAHWLVRHPLRLPFERKS